MGGFSESDLAVFTNTRNQDISDYVGPNVELVVSPVDHAAASATQFSESDLAVFTNTRNQDISDCVGPNFELVVSPVDYAAASATELTCFKLPTSDILTRSGDFGGHILRGISRILRARNYLDPPHRLTCE
jgi:hypothetical protein